MIRFANVFEKQNSYFETFKYTIDGHQTKLSHTVQEKCPTVYLM